MFDILSGVGKALKSFTSDLSDVRLEIEKLLREIEDIQFAPAHPDDVIKALDTWAKGNAAKYHEYLRAQLGKLFHEPAMLLDQGAVWLHFHRQQFLPVLGALSANGSITHDIQMCGLLGPDGFVALMKKQMQTIELPAPGLPLAERPQAIATLEKRITKLRDREASLIASAEKAGLHIS